MVRNIMSNQDVEEILNRTVELIEGAFAEYGVPHVEPVFAEEHVMKIEDKSPVQYQDVLKYKSTRSESFLKKKLLIERSMQSRNVT